MIEQAALDAAGKVIHDEWAREKNERKRPLDLVEYGGEAGADRKGEERKGLYDKFEYYRTASMATALYREVVSSLHLGEEDFGRDGKEKYEHLRWYAYMCAEGFSHADRTDFVGKIHTAMTDYRK